MKLFRVQLIVRQKNFCLNSFFNKQEILLYISLVISVDYKPYSNPKMSCFFKQSQLKKLKAYRRQQRCRDHEGRSEGCFSKGGETAQANPIQT